MTISDQSIPPNELERLHRVEPWRFYGKCAILAALLLAFGTAAAACEGPALRIPLLIVLGVLFAHATELAHQCIHKVATGSAVKDHLFGVILSLLSPSFFFYYLWNHLRHHRNNGTPSDKESFGYAYDLLHSESRGSRLRGFLIHATLFKDYLLAIRWMVLAVAGRLDAHLRTAYPEMPANIRRNMRREGLLKAGLLALALAVSIAFQTTIILQIWLLSMLLTWGLAHSLIELPEHWQCDVPNSDVFVNTRSLKAGWFARWITNNNNNHVGHHHDMHVPMDKLEEYEVLLRRDHEFRHQEGPYAGFYLRFFKHLWFGPTRPTTGRLTADR